MLVSDSTIAYRAGTYRTASPEQTWQRIQPMLDQFMITRVADITHLDEIGLPVHVAYRPAGTTLAVSIGTGLTAAQARVSAAMESVELWHAENPWLDIERRCPARDLGLPYDIRNLNLALHSPLTDRVVLDWVGGVGLTTGQRYLVPADTIQVDFTGRTWATVLFRPTTNGLASGNSSLDATLHALLELIERDCVSDFYTTPLAGRPSVDPAASRHPDTATVYAALRAAGCRIEVYDITNRIGVPCYSARIWSPDVPMTCGGFGCHVDPDIAIGRALLEAAQSRLCTVSGARDDIPLQAYEPSDPLPVPPGPHQDLPPMADLGDDIADVVRYCSSRVAGATGVEPFVVDLTHPRWGIPVSKVFAPGLRLHEDIGHRSRSEGRDD